MIVIILDQIVLREDKKLISEIEKKIAGLGRTMSRRLSSLCGCLPNTYIKKISTKNSIRLMTLYNTHVGLYNFEYYNNRKMFNIRRAYDKAYRNKRFSLGYPVNQRTRSNANTASRKLDIQNSLMYFGKLKRNFVSKSQYTSKYANNKRKGGISIKWKQKSKRQLQKYKNKAQSRKYGKKNR